MKNAVLFIAFLVVFLGNVNGQEIRKVIFQPGHHTAILKHAIQHRNYVDYAFQGKAGDIYTIDLEAAGSSVFFNLLAADGKTEVFNGQKKNTTSFSGKLPSGGAYRVRVYLANPTRNDIGVFTLTITKPEE